MRHTAQKAGIAIALAIAVTLTVGCQSSINGQVLPSDNYLQDDVSYFPAGPEFKLPREAAALQAARAQEKASR